jgi:hypothetical protein
LLVDELGIEPGPALQELHQAILTGTGTVGPAQPQPPAAGPVVPRQLPPAIPYVTGRAAEIRALDTLLAAAAPGDPAVIMTLGGAPGIGKTALAVHWAHRVADRFPDGQVFVDLRGFDPERPATPVAAAVRQLLDAFGVPPQRIPAQLDAQVGLYRSLVAGRRVLVVLDNARDADQVRPLLPGAPGCFVLVTSRDRLTGLTAGGAHPVSLDVLAPTAGVAVLARHLGRLPVAAEPAAVDEIVAACAGSPLALGIVAARAAGRPGFPLAGLAAELRHSAGLDAFDTGEPAGTVRAVFSSSYQALPAPAARLFRLLGVVPGAPVSEPAVASLADVPAETARRLLAELARVHLVSEPTPGHYRLHDLLHAYAGELAATHDPDRDRRAATGRLLDHYLHAAVAGARSLDPTWQPVPTGPPRPGVMAVELTGRTAADWFAAEYPALRAAVEYAAASGFDAHCWRLAACVARYLERGGRFTERAMLQRTALIAARRAADRAG